MHVGYLHKKKSKRWFLLLGWWLLCYCVTVSGNWWLFAWHLALCVLWLLTTVKHLMILDTWLLSAVMCSALSWLLSAVMCSAFQFQMTGSVCSNSRYSFFVCFVFDVVVFDLMWFVVFPDFLLLTYQAWGLYAHGRRYAPVKFTECPET